MELKLSSSVETIGTNPSRSNQNVYWNELGVDARLEILSKIEGITGIFTFYPSDSLPFDPIKMLKKLDEFNLKPAQMYVDSNSNRKWKNGAFSNKEKHIRTDCIKLYKEAIDFAKEINADSVLLLPGMDGLDYPFQADPRDAWKYLVDTIREICEYKSDVKIAIEPQKNAPRQRMYLSDIGKLQMLLNEIGLDNVGGVLDVGQLNISQGGMAEALTILNSHQKLFAIHLNDNFRNAAPDMIMGSVHFWEFLELFYYLNKTDFNGYCDLHLESLLDDRVKSLALSAKLTLKLKTLADKLTEHSDEIDSNLNNYRFVENIELINKIIFK
jgi:xylose isomerase